MGRKILLGIAVVSLLGATAAFVFRKSILLAFASPERRACAKMGEVCGNNDGGLRELEACEDGFAKARKLVGDAPVDRSIACIADTQSCIGATGCVIGGIGIGALSDFGKGFGSASSK